MQNLTELKIIQPDKVIWIKDEQSVPVGCCAYCRVSTIRKDEEDYYVRGSQRNSYESQVAFFQKEFEYHQNWIGKRVFADQGISGTSLKKRDAFNEMIALAKQGFAKKDPNRIRLILTKEVSRFSRNIQDTLNIVSELHEIGVYIWFLTDDIYTEAQDYREELIKVAEQAEAESRRTSKRVNWAHDRQMESGVVLGRRELYGYNIRRDVVTNKQEFEIIPEEAEVVRRIFRMYADGMGTFKIAKQLEQEGIKTKRYKNGWSNTVILRILRNEKYVGDLRQGKTYTPDVLTHKKKYNRKNRRMYDIPGHHADKAIIDRELWEKVQRRLEENTISPEAKAKHSNRYWCSGKVVCGECGQRYISRTKHLKNGTIYKSWKCWDSQQNGAKKTITLDSGEVVERGCNSESVNDKVLQQGIYDIITQIIRPDFQIIFDRTRKEYQKRLEKEAGGDLETQIAELQARAEKITNTLANLAINLAEGVISKEAHRRASESKEAELQEVHGKLEKLNATTYDEKAIMDKLESQLAVLKKAIFLEDEEITDDIYRSIIDRIEVHNGHILKYYIIGLSRPITLHYETSGRMSTFEIKFTVLPDAGEAVA